MGGMGFDKAEPARTGRPGYDPRDLLEVYLYGCINRVRSSRRLQRECARNIEVKWLINSLEPDFRTISDFRKNNRLAIKETFKAFIAILREARLLGEELTMDGTRIRANNSIKRSFTPELTAKKLQYIEEQTGKLEACLNGMDSCDEREETNASPVQPPGKDAGKYEGRHPARIKTLSRPEGIKACLHAGALPAGYEGTNIRVEAQERGTLSCFIRHADSTVACSMGQTLYKHQDKRYGTQYGSREARRTCANRYTDAKSEKTVLTGCNFTAVPVLM